MIVDLPDTTTADVSRALVDLRNEGGAVALGRVLTLVISATSGSEEAAIQAANDASREHPMRVLVLERRNRHDDAARLDAQIRVGGDTGASEVVILRTTGAAGEDEESLVTGLLLPDAPVVAWWPGADRPSVPAESALGRIAQLRLTDAAASSDIEAGIRRLTTGYRPGDSDFAWTRLTGWRALLAAILDQPPLEQVEAIEVSAAGDSTSAELLAAWLQHAFGVPVALELFDRHERDVGVRSVLLRRASGITALSRRDPETLHLQVPGQPDHEVALPRRSQRDCLIEELRRLGPDPVLGAVLTVDPATFEDLRLP